VRPQQIEIPRIFR